MNSISNKTHFESAINHLTGITNDNEVDIIIGIHNVCLELFDDVPVKITYEINNQYYETGRTNIQMTGSKEIAEEWLNKRKTVRIKTNYKAKIEWENKIDHEYVWNMSDGKLHLKNIDVESIENKLKYLSEKETKIIKIN